MSELVQDERKIILSIIIPVYNAENRITQCIDSILDAVGDNVELIVVNDGSYDASLQICKKKAKEDLRLKVFSQDNKGVSAARNKGLEKSKGTFITFVDADDYVSSNYGRIESILNSYQVDIYMFNFSMEMKEGLFEQRRFLEETKVIDIKKVYESCLNEKSNSVCCNVYRRDIISENKIIFPLGVRIGEDLLFNLKYIFYCKNAFYLNESLYIYYINPKSAMHKYILTDLLDYQKIFEELELVHSKFENLDFRYERENYLKKIFLTLIYTDYERDNNIIRSFEESKLWDELCYTNYTNNKYELISIFIKMKLYQIRILKKLMRYFLDKIKLI